MLLSIKLDLITDLDASWLFPQNVASSEHIKTTISCVDDPIPIQIDAANRSTHGSLKPPARKSCEQQPTTHVYFFERHCSLFPTLTNLAIQPMHNPVVTS